MKQEVKEKWLTALRSGEYTQGKGRLRSLDDKFCCLGVLCDLAVKNEIIDGPVQEGHGYAYCAEGDGFGEPYFLPLAVAEWAGFGPEIDSPEVNGDGLVTLNDDSNFTFEQIAQLIEEHL